MTFVFVCFSGCHFTWEGFTKKDNVQKKFFKYLHVCLTCLHIISKIWKYIMLLSFMSQNSQCALVKTYVTQKPCVIELIPIYVYTATRSAIQYVIVIKRRLEGHIWQTYVPSFLLSIFGVISVFIPSDVVNGRIRLTLNSFLSLVSLFGSAR